VPTRVSLFLAAAVAALGLALFVVLLSPQVRAGPPPPVTVLDAAALRGSGGELTLTMLAIEGEGMVEPRSSADRADARPLAASPDGKTVAVSTVKRGQAGPLTLAREDGSQLEVALPGVWGAAFEPGGAWLALVDLSGALWQVDAISGAAVRLGDGPYGPDPTVLPDGRILAVRLSAVDAPIWAAAVTVDPATGDTAPVGSTAAEDQLVYGATALTDGSVVLVRHQVGGGVSLVQPQPDGTETTLTDLAGAATVAVSPDGRWRSWPEAGVTWLAAMDTGSPPVRIGAGSLARFSPDAALLMLFDPESTAIVDLDGARIARVGPTACWLGDGRGCRP
jgi:hypothetical protein